MRRPHDDSLVESALRRNLVRHPAPFGFTERVMGGIHEERRPKPLQTGLPFRRLSMRMGIGLTGCACLAMMLFTVGRPTDRNEHMAEQAALDVAALQLVDALQLAGNKWNQAQEAALSPGLENDDE